MLEQLPLLLAGAFLAGLVDAVVGGGGLIQVPLLLACFPQYPIAVLFGTNKLVSIAGTSSAAFTYARHVKLNWGVLLPACVAALFGSALGASVVSFLPPSALRPTVLALLIGVAIYTAFRPAFGASHTTGVVGRHVLGAACIVGLLIGFYDGFFGPGTGSFLIFIFVRLFGMDMLHASGSAKIINVATNLGALAWFISHDGILWWVAAAMAVSNVLGAQVGSRVALWRGNGFVRWVLLSVVSVLIVKLGLDLYRGN